MSRIYSHSVLTALAAASTSFYVDEYFWITGFRVNSLHVGKEIVAVDKLSFNCYTKAWDEFLSDFLRDPARSGKYVVTGQHYAAAAECLLRQMLDEMARGLQMKQWKLSPSSRPFGGAPNSNMRKNLYNSRSKRVQHHSRIRSKVFSVMTAKKIKQRALRRWKNRCSHLRRWPSFATFLAALCWFLSQADQSDELVAAVCDRKFWLYTQIFEWDRWSTQKREVIRYLKRIGSTQPSFPKRFQIAERYP